MSFSLLKLNNIKKVCVLNASVLLLLFLLRSFGAKINEMHEYVFVRLKNEKKWFSTEYAAKSNIIIYFRSKYVCVLVFFVFDFFCSFFFDHRWNEYVQYTYMLYTIVHNDFGWNSLPFTLVDVDFSCLCCCCYSRFI